MLRHASTLCRAVLNYSTLDATLEATTHSVQLQYAACSVVKEFTSHVRGMAMAQVQQQRQVTAAAEGAGGGSGIVIHESAVRRLKELQSESPNKPVKLRVEVEGGGCSGFQYKFRLDDQVASDDIVYERDGVQVVCDTVSMDFLKGAVVEYEDSLMRSAFQIASNPNSESTCGCGTSFVAKI